MTIILQPGLDQILRIILLVPLPLLIIPAYGLFYRYKVDAPTEIIQGKLGESSVNLITLLSSTDALALPLYRDESDLANPHPPVILISATPTEASLHGTGIRINIDLESNGQNANNVL